MHVLQMDQDASDLVSKLLQKDISRRYGNLREGCKDIKEHPFYAAKKFDWGDFAQRGGALCPPMFDANKFERVNAEEVVLEGKMCKTEDQSHFKGF